MQERRIDIALLILRIVLGTTMAFMHGWLKLTGGVEGWESLGKTMQHVGIGFFPVFWGFMAMLIEVGGGICLILGVAVRPVAGAMLLVMCMALIANLAEGYGWEGSVEILEVSAILVCLLLLGSGGIKVGGKGVRVEGNKKL
ncbi:MAG: DoxX family protein [Chitinophagaceae bacterium]|nr:DoxX family protein [Chitinophagaceae bacterium]